MDRRHARALLLSVFVASVSGLAAARQGAQQPTPEKSAQFAQPAQRTPGAAAPTPPPAGQAPGAPGTPGAPGERGPGRGPGMQVPVSVAMKTIERAYKALKPQVADSAKQEENLRLIAEMQRGIAVSKAQAAPEDVLAHAKSEDEKTKMRADYRRALTAAMRLMLDIEADIEAGRGADAAKKLETLDDLEHESHEALGVGEEH